MAVFIPTSFMGGTSGVFYTQFGLTMAVAVGISAINALTLSPALCVLIMTPHMDKFDRWQVEFFLPVFTMHLRLLSIGWC